MIAAANEKCRNQALQILIDKQPKLALAYHFDCQPVITQFLVCILEN
jgi:hypothetical protein